MKYIMTKGNGLYRLVDCLKHKEKEKNKEGGKEIKGLKSDRFLPPQALQKAQTSPCANQVKTALRSSQAKNHQVECGRERDTERRWYALWLV